MAEQAAEHDRFRFEMRGRSQQVFAYMQAVPQVVSQQIDKVARRERRCRRDVGRVSLELEVAVSRRDELLAENAKMAAQIEQ